MIPRAKGQVDTGYYKSEEGKKLILELYDKKLDELNIDYEQITLMTKNGLTNIIAAGNDSNPSLVLLHGSNGCAPIILETFPNLTKRYKVYAVDLLAQPTKSQGTRLNMKNDDYGKWLVEVIDSLGINSVTLVGYSLGGLVALKTLEYDETKIKEVFLVSPAYVTNASPLKALFKVFIPMKKYMKKEEEGYLNRFLNNLFTEPDSFAKNFIPLVLKHFDMDFTPVPVIKKKRAQTITTPITLFASEEDVLFGGEKMIKRAKNIFPSLKRVELIKNSKHVPDRKMNTYIENLILQP